MSSDAFSSSSSTCVLTAFAVLTLLLSYFRCCFDVPYLLVATFALPAFLEIYLFQWFSNLQLLMLYVTSFLFIFHRQLPFYNFSRHLVFRRHLSEFSSKSDVTLCCSLFFSDCRSLIFFYSPEKTFQISVCLIVFCLIAS